MTLVDNIATAADIDITLTSEEREILLQTVMTSTYAGQLAPLVARILVKLRRDDPCEV